MPNPTRGSPPAEGEPRDAERHPTREEIESRAFQTYVERGAAEGHDLEDWLQAERELLEKCGQASRTAKAGAT